MKPLLYDKDLISKWDNSYGAHGVNCLAETLFFDLIRELFAISLDQDERSPSAANILRLLDCDDLVQALKEDFCEPTPATWCDEVDEESRKFWDQRLEKRDLEEKIRLFDCSIHEARKALDDLRESDLGKRIKAARMKYVAHYEMRASGDTPRIVRPEDLGLLWGDVEAYFEKLKPIIASLMLVISNESYALDMWRENHEKVADEFWGK